MRSKIVGVVVVALASMPAFAARAEDPYGPQGQPVAQPMGPPLGDPNQQPQGPVVQQDPSVQEQAEEGRGIQYGAHLYVPIFLGDQRLGAGSAVARITPGFGVVGRVGWEFGSGFSAELYVGFQLNGTSFVGGVTNTSISNIYGGAGMRYAFLNPSMFVPFVGAGLQLNFWGIGESYGGTYSSSNDYIALGFNATAGLVIEISADIGIEAGLRWDLTTAGSDGSTFFFDGATSYLSPFLGGTLYFD
jgi:hypothetical protein